ncbi:MAG: hypothetical protein EOQ86_30250 [Mesorhizobium sp.]|uniref:hypothetical protein n=1 Tax=Mesorhizobium sp. TaxID=1871066 RepID=UPI000FEA44DD|nr:hypothetical protein [Mesorhizobium sp.]RWH69478.1 MAG: hypothetical protein EOQ85_32835 [Mesorhizobium sp.]RWH76344.1 MAG: hypothetical protein EOQ86_30250 [Mesorhizobium sp.]RWH83526.1 MAG: hypothetical protein EOQ87_32750 [Mesorhizobium sp.]RWH91543.1 MAG: hypothetical protein EOQ88_31765 [Mesorhizobium sp.]RWH95815.1 MAG: hypothetical protein EOQ89_30420 [Mesorhizobium sp.]
MKLSSLTVPAGLILLAATLTVPAHARVVSSSGEPGQTGEEQERQQERNDAWERGRKQGDLEGYERGVQTEKASRALQQLMDDVGGIGSRATQE